MKPNKTSKKRGGRTAAVVDIGSNLLRMRICQLKRGELSDVEYLEYPVSIGHEVFTSGKISFESIRAVSAALQGFSRLMGEYGTETCRVVATTALREAGNRAFAVDQLKIQNGIQVEILEDNQEKSLIYGEMLERLTDKPQDCCSMFSYIGTGSIGIAVFRGETIEFSKNIPIGALKLHDMLGSLQALTTGFHEVLEEYLHASIGRILAVYPGGLPSIRRLVLAGSDSHLIARLCGVKEENGCYTIKTQALKELYRKICTLTPEKISYSYRIAETEAELLYTALAIYVYLAELTKVKEITAPCVDLIQPIMKEILFPKNKDRLFSRQRENILGCARLLASSFCCSQPHSEKVAAAAGMLFDKMKEIHGLDARKRLLLELAAVLHECGYHIQPRQFSMGTFQLVRSMDIFGLTEEELYSVAAIFLPAGEVSPPVFVSSQQRLVVSKLAAMFRLADALDQSQKQKLKNLKVRLDKNRLLVSAESLDEAALEQWAFRQAVPFFEDVFGVRPELAIRPASANASGLGKV